jgi:hypothetical protein
MSGACVSSVSSGPSVTPSGDGHVQFIVSYHLNFVLEIYFSNY